MARLRALIVTCCLLMLIAACGGNPVPATPAKTATATIAPIGWDTKPGSILVRFDRQTIGDTPISMMNRIPACTLYGDGYVVWVNLVPPGGEEIFEARLSDSTVRSFLDYMIREQRFFSIPDYAARQLPPVGKYEIDSVTLRINNETRTVRNYGSWPSDEYNTMVDKCTHLTSEPVTYLPSGAWMSVQPIAGSQEPRLNWAVTAGFRLGDVAATGKPMWVTGSVLVFLWDTLHRSQGVIQWIEDGKPYKIGLQVPGVSREAPPAPAITPTMPVYVPSATPTPPATSTSRPPPDAAVSATPIPAATQKK